MNYANFRKSFLLIEEVMEELCLPENTNVIFDDFQDLVLLTEEINCDVNGLQLLLENDEMKKFMYKNIQIYFKK